MRIALLILVASIFIVGCGGEMSTPSPAEEASPPPAKVPPPIVDAGPIYEGCSALLDGETWSYWYEPIVLASDAPSGSNVTCMSVGTRSSCWPCTLDRTSPYAQCPIPTGVPKWDSISYNPIDKTVYVLSEHDGLVPLCVAGTVDGSQTHDR